MKRKEFYALGVMSGTSTDGLDFSLIKSDGKEKIKIIQNKYYKFNHKFKMKILNAINEFKQLKKSNKENEIFKNLNEDFSRYVLKKLNLFFLSSKAEMNKIDIIGIHGNTVIHNPKKGKSIQLGDAELISKELNKPVIYDFRKSDILSGGEGAPLVPIFHRAIFSKKKKNIIVVNIGGISNFTFLNGKKTFFASDIGPGNILIDDFCQKNFNKGYDFEGKIAKKGKIKFELINLWLKKKIFFEKFPKSFDTQDFNFMNLRNYKTYSTYDVLRTLTFFSAKLISMIKMSINFKIDSWVFSGGGVNNSLLMSDIKKLLINDKISISNSLGYDSSFVESAAFAYISIRTLKKLPSAFPKTTGCIKENVCGNIHIP